jgi:hypothetical protein
MKIFWCYTGSYWNAWQNFNHELLASCRTRKKYLKKSMSKNKMTFFYFLSYNFFLLLLVFYVVPQPRRFSGMKQLFSLIYTWPWPTCTEINPRLVLKNHRIVDWRRNLNQKMYIRVTGLVCDRFKRLEV